MVAINGETMHGAVINGWDATGVVYNGNTIFKIAQDYIEWQSIWGVTESSPGGEYLDFDNGSVEFDTSILNFVTSSIPGSPFTYGVILQLNTNNDMSIALAIGKNWSSSTVGGVELLWIFWENGICVGSYPVYETPTIDIPDGAYMGTITLTSTFLTIPLTQVGAQYVSSVSSGNFNYNGNFRITKYNA